ncbi:MAG: zf-HC2 domain-containing protein [Actinobacteria bacterium]|nr:zf-HC2 domain-containing protein [Actinomycetota bacterium]MCL5883368.1 zf-HC2 domain-containing protein [Actinomycetota bacterium]
MDCREILEGLSEYIDDELAEKTCQEIREHLKDCYNCQVVVNTLRQTVTLYREVPDDEIPGDVSMRLHKIIKLTEDND